MKKLLLSCFIVMLISTATYAQMQIDKPIQLTGTTGERSITNLETPINGTDAANKNYVDAAVAAGGGGSSKPAMMSIESGLFTIDGAVQYCESLAEAGFSDWRLPTIEEITYFAGDATASSNYLWTKSQANGKENPVNQNYAVIRLTDGKWRNAGEVTGLLLARTVTSSITVPGSWASFATLTPITSGNVIVPTHVKLTSLRVASGGSLSSSCYTGGYTQYRLKMNFADGSSSYSSVFTNTATPETFVDMQSIPLLTSVTPLNSIEVEMQTTDPGGSTYRMQTTLVVSGYEITMTQKDANTLRCRCVR